MKKTTIGQAHMTYNEDGSIKNAAFTPELKVEFDAAFLSKLFKIEGTSQEALKANADLVLGAWFEDITDKLDEIETADRSRYEVVSRVVECKKYSTGTVEVCTLEYAFQERPDTLN